MGITPRIILWLVTGFILIALLLAYQSGAFTDAPSASGVRVDSVHLSDVAIAKTPHATIVIDNTTHIARHCYAWLRMGPSNLFVGDPHEDIAVTPTVLLGADRIVSVDLGTKYPVSAAAGDKLARASAGVRCGKERSKVVTTSTVVAP